MGVYDGSKVAFAAILNAVKETRTATAIRQHHHIEPADLASMRMPLVTKRVRMLI